MISFPEELIFFVRKDALGWQSVYYRQVSKVTRGRGWEFD